MTTAALELTTATPPHAAPKIANVPGRLGPRWLNLLRAQAERPWKRRLAKAAVMIPRIRHYERLYLTLSEEDIRKTSMRLRGRAKGGEKLDKLVPEAFGLACSAIRR